MDEKTLSVIKKLQDIEDEDEFEKCLDEIIDPNFSKKLNDFLEGLEDEFFI